MPFQHRKFTPTRGPRLSATLTRGSSASHESGGQNGQLWKATLPFYGPNVVE